MGRRRQRIRGAITSARLAAGLLRVRATGEQRPLIVSWTITHRCNLRCAYCDVPLQPLKELDTTEALAFVAEMRALGTRAVSLTGGEPLVRTDIVEIVAALRAAGMLVSINSNGTYLPRRAGVLEHLSRMQLSLDGPAHVHDPIRGPDSFAEVETAARMVRDAGLPLVLSVVLSRHNLHTLDELVEIARDWGARLSFHPVGPVHAFDLDYEAQRPTKTQMGAAIDHLERLARAGAPILGSPSSFAYLRHWPEAPPIACFGARAMAKLAADGQVFPCAILEHRTRGGDARREGFAEAFASIADDPLACSGCHCTKTLQLNRVFWDLVDAVPWSARALLAGGLTLSRPEA